MIAKRASEVKRTEPCRHLRVPAHSLCNALVTLFARFALDISLLFRHSILNNNHSLLPWLYIFK